MFLKISLEENYFDYDVESEQVRQKKIKENKEKYYSNNDNYNYNHSSNTDPHNSSIYNKFDAFDDPDYSYFRGKLEMFKKKDKSKINEAYKSFLSIDAEPYYPKESSNNNDNKENNNFKEILNKIDLNNVKEYVPKNYKLVKKDKNQ